MQELRDRPRVDPGEQREDEQRGEEPRLARSHPRDGHERQGQRDAAGFGARQLLAAREWEEVAEQRRLHAARRDLQRIAGVELRAHLVLAGVRRRFEERQERDRGEQQRDDARDNDGRGAAPVSQQEQTVDRSHRHRVQ